MSQCVASPIPSNFRPVCDPGFVETVGHASKFIQVLDESMCVVREDLNEWLQRYLFSEHAPPIEPHFLLYRLGSGLWLARLAYKLHISVLQPSASQNKTDYKFLRGTSASSLRLKSIANSSRLPTFPSSLAACSRIPLGPTDVSPNPATSGNQPIVDAMGNLKYGSGGGSLRIADRWAARDNVSCFIQWCKDLGVALTVLFETTGLVHRTEEKNVLLTLMELARIASMHGLLDVPELVRMEMEIDALEADRLEREQVKSIRRSTTTAESDSADSISESVGPHGDDPREGFLAGDHVAKMLLASSSPRQSTDTTDFGLGSSSLSDAGSVTSDQMCQTESSARPVHTAVGTTAANTDIRESNRLAKGASRPADPFITAEVSPGNQTLMTPRGNMQAKSYGLWSDGPRSGSARSTKRPRLDSAVSVVPEKVARHVNLDPECQELSCTPVKQVTHDPCVTPLSALNALRLSAHKQRGRLRRLQNLKAAPPSPSGDHRIGYDAITQQVSLLGRLVLLRAAPLCSTTWTSIAC